MKITNDPFQRPKRPSNVLHGALTLIGGAIFTASLFFAESRREQLVEANQIVADAKYKLAAVALEHHKVQAFAQKVDKAREQLNRSTERAATNASALFATTTNTLDGTFSALTYIDTNGISRQVAYVDGRPYLDFPYKVPLMKFSDLEWNWMTNQLSGLLVTGKKAEETSTVFTEKH